VCGPAAGSDGDAGGSVKTTSKLLLLQMASEVVEAAAAAASLQPPSTPTGVTTLHCITYCLVEKGKGSPYSIAERRVPELIPVLGSQPAGDVSHKPGGRLPLLSARPAVTSTTLKRAATSFAAW